MRATQAPATYDAVGHCRKTRTSKTHIPELDGIRGVAILLVLICHFGWYESPSGWEHSFREALQLGWIGVDLFFTLSGFLITGILLDTKQTRNYFSSFYVRRALRIFPLYFCFLLSFFHFLMPAMHHTGKWQEVQGTYEIWFWLYGANFLSAFGHFVPMLDHFWSLAIEEQFYFVWPLIVYLTPLHWIGRLCIGAAGFSMIAKILCLATATQSTPSTYFLTHLTPLHLEPLAFGALAAYLVRQHEMELTKKRLRNLAGIAIGCLVVAIVIARSTLYGTPAMATLGTAALATAFTCVILWCVMYRETTVSNWMTHPVLRSFGTYSYGIYVLHMILAQYVTGSVVLLTAKLGAHYGWKEAIVSVGAGIPLSYVAGRCSWLLIEKRCLALKSRFEAHPLQNNQESPEGRDSTEGSGRGVNFHHGRTKSIGG